MRDCLCAAPSKRGRTPTAQSSDNLGVTTVLTLTAERLRGVAEAIFRAAGAPEDIAARVAEALVEANLTGHDSHGVQHIANYVRSVREGLIVPDARPEVLEETPTTALVAGRWGFGHVAAAFGTRLAIRKAREQRVAAVAIVECNHIGRVGEYAAMAAREGVVALIAAGGFAEPPSRGQAAPYGGAQPALGTNPIALGFPAGEREPPFLDFATTTVAAGKIALARARGERLPPGCALDSDGRPTTDPEDYYRGGMLLPFGGHKGYALAVAVELLGRALTGADAYASDKHGGPIFAHSGVCILAVDGGAFQPRARFGVTVDATLRRLKAVPPAEGFREVLVPGDPEWRSREARLRDGIPVPEATWAAIRDTARSLRTQVD